MADSTEAGHPAVVERLLAAGNFDEAMRWAAICGRLSLVDRLLAAGATGFDRAMRSAAYHGHLAVVERLLVAGATDLDEAMAVAAAEGHLAVVERLLAAGATASTYAMESAAAEGHLAVVECLLAAGATDFNHAMVCAAGNYHAAVVERLLAAGATDSNMAIRMLENQESTACFRALARRAPLALALEFPRFAALVAENDRDLSAAAVVARTALVPDLLEYLVKPLLRLVQEEGGQHNPRGVRGVFFG